MYYVVYIDILFLVNFFMDFIVLTLNGKVLRKKVSFLRRFIAACLGAVCYCIPFFLHQNLTRNLLGCYMLFVSFLMVKIAYQTKGKKEFIKALIFFYSTNFFAGGAISGLYNYTKLGYYIRQTIKGDKDAQITIGVWILFVCAACFLWNFLMRFYRKKQIETIIYPVILKKGKRMVRDKALLDTGNQLREPISKEPVMLINMSLAEKLLEREIFDAIHKFYQTGEISIPIHLIPFHSIGKKQGMLAAVRIDYLKIQKEEQQVEVVHPYVAVSPEILSKTGEYQILLHIDWFTG